MIVYALAHLSARLIALADILARVLAWGLGHFTPVCGAGVFLHPNAEAFWGAWREPSANGGGSLVVRMGRTEAVLDWCTDRARKSV